MLDSSLTPKSPAPGRPRDLMRTGHTLVPGIKVQPQAKELEEVVLGAMMMEKSAVNAVIDVLQPESFSLGRTVKCFGRFKRYSTSLSPLTCSP